MPKIIMGAALVAVAIATIASGGVVGALGAYIVSSMLTMGGGLLMSGIANLLAHNPGIGISVRQPAAAWQIVYGQARVGGVIAYLSLSNDNVYLQMVDIMAAHQIEALDFVYLDGKKVYATLQDDGETWAASGGDHYDYANNKYNFDGKVFYQIRLGSPTQTAFDSLIGIGDDTFTSASTFSGRACLQLSLHYSTDAFPAGIPGIKYDIRGKNDVYDPRTATSGYTTNAALCQNDFICNQDFGFKAEYATEMDEVQLIADANLCDEQVLTSQGYEPRYTINGTFSTDSTPGDALQGLLTANAGRITYIGGLWKIFSGSFTGYSLLFDESDLTAPVKWNATRKYRDLNNAVSGTFISPCYPYIPAGPGLYDNEPQSDIFDGQWQPTSFPQYQQDVAHGYSGGDALLAEDGTRLIKDLQLRYTISVAAAQRLAKIELMRSRLNDGTLSMKMTAYQAQCLDNIQMTFSLFGWGGKVLEITNFAFKVDTDSAGKNAPLLGIDLNVQENDASVYAWSTAEELPMDSNGMRVPDNNNPQPVLGLTLDSSSATSVVNKDGIRTPRILATWTPPNDGLVVQYQLQIQENTGSGPGPWLPCGLVSADLNSCYISGVTVGASYNVQIASQYKTGALSSWYAVGPEVVSDTYSSITSSEIFDDLGNIQPTQSVPFSITSNIVDPTTGTTADTTIASAAVPSYTLPSGTVLNLPASNFPFTGLALTSSYVAYPRYCIATGVIDCPDGACLNGSTDALAKQNLDGYIALNIVSWTTPNSGGGGGTTNGGGSCPHEDEPVRVWSAEHGPDGIEARAGDVEAGDWVRGLDLQSNREVWRHVQHVELVPGKTWSAVPDNGTIRLVTPFEKVWHDGQWVEAHLVPGAQDVEREGRRVRITLAARRFADQNYFVGGVLVHNTRIGKGD